MQRGRQALDVVCAFFSCISPHTREKGPFLVYYEPNNTYTVKVTTRQLHHPKAVISTSAQTFSANSFDENQAKETVSLQLLRYLETQGIVPDDWWRWPPNWRETSEPGVLRFFMVCYLLILKDTCWVNRRSVTKFHIVPPARDLASKILDDMIREGVVVENSTEQVRLATVQEYNIFLQAPKEQQQPLPGQPWPDTVASREQLHMPSSREHPRMPPPGREQQQHQLCPGREPLHMPPVRDQPRLAQDREQSWSGRPPSREQQLHEPPYHSEREPVYTTADRRPPRSLAPPQLREPQHAAADRDVFAPSYMPDDPLYPPADHCVPPQQQRERRYSVGDGRGPSDQQHVPAYPPADRFAAPVQQRRPPSGTSVAAADRYGPPPLRRDAHLPICSGTPDRFNAPRQQGRDEHVYQQRRGSPGPEHRRDGPPLPHQHAIDDPMYVPHRDEQVYPQQRFDQTPYQQHRDEPLVAPLQPQWGGRDLAPVYQQRRDDPRPYQPGRDAVALPQPNQELLYSSHRGRELLASQRHGGPPFPQHEQQTPQPSRYDFDSRQQQPQRARSSWSGDTAARGSWDGAGSVSVAHGERQLGAAAGVGPGVWRAGSAAVDRPGSRGASLPPYSPPRREYVQPSDQQRQHSSYSPRTQQPQQYSPRGPSLRPPYNPLPDRVPQQQQPPYSQRRDMFEQPMASPARSSAGHAAYAQEPQQPRWVEDRQPLRPDDRRTHLPAQQHQQQRQESGNKRRQPQLPEERLPPPALRQQQREPNRQPIGRSSPPPNDAINRQSKRQPMHEERSGAAAHGGGSLGSMQRGRGVSDARADRQNDSRRKSPSRDKHTVRDAAAAHQQQRHSRDSRDRGSKDSRSYDRDSDKQQRPTYGNTSRTVVPDRAGGTVGNRSADRHRERQTDRAADNSKRGTGDRSSSHSRVRPREGSRQQGSKAADRHRDSRHDKEHSRADRGKTGDRKAEREKDRSDKDSSKSKRQRHGDSAVAGTSVAQQQIQQQVQGEAANETKGPAAADAADTTAAVLTTAADIEGNEAAAGASGAADAGVDTVGASVSQQPAAPPATTAAVAAAGASSDPATAADPLAVIATADNEHTAAASADIPVEGSIDLQQQPPAVLQAPVQQSLPEGLSSAVLKHLQIAAPFAVAVDKIQSHFADAAGSTDILVDSLLQALVKAGQVELYTMEEGKGQQKQYVRASQSVCLKQGPPQIAQHQGVTDAAVDAAAHDAASNETAEVAAAAAAPTAAEQIAPQDGLDQSAQGNSSQQQQQREPNTYVDMQDGQLLQQNATSQVSHGTAVTVNVVRPAEPELQQRQKHATATGLSQGEDVDRMMHDGAAVVDASTMLPTQHLQSPQQQQQHSGLDAGLLPQGHAQLQVHGDDNQTVLVDTASPQPEQQLQQDVQAAVSSMQDRQTVQQNSGDLAVMDADVDATVAAAEAVHIQQDEQLLQDSMDAGVRTVNADTAGSQGAVADDDLEQQQQAAAVSPSADDVHDHTSVEMLLPSPAADTEEAIHDTSAVAAAVVALSAGAGTHAGAALQHTDDLVQKHAAQKAQQPDQEQQRQPSESNAETSVLSTEDAGDVNVDSVSQYDGAALNDTLASPPAGAALQEQQQQHQPAASIEGTQAANTASVTLSSVWMADVSACEAVADAGTLHGADADSVGLVHGQGVETTALVDHTVADAAPAADTASDSKAVAAALLDAVITSNISSDQHRANAAADAGPEQQIPVMSAVAVAADKQVGSAAAAAAEEVVLRYRRASATGAVSASSSAEAAQAAVAVPDVTMPASALAGSMLLATELTGDGAADKSVAPADATQHANNGDIMTVDTAVEL